MLPMEPHRILPDALLVERIAALADKAALGELYGRHGMSLYAIAYTVLFDPEAADAAVAAAFREVWLSAASFSASHGSVRRWLADLTRRSARGSLTTRPVPLLVA
jgi:RNA polymerase sigma-70 factor, ECF subfamily